MEGSMRDLMRTTKLAAVLSLIAAPAALANSFTEDAYGYYNGDECGALNDMTLMIEPGVFQFHESYCEVQSEEWNFPNAKVSLLCFGEGEEWQEDLLINVGGNGSLLVEPPDGSFSVVYQYCG